MADNEIRNPAKAYFKWKMPVIAKSEDDWNFWNTEDKYNRTMFIGYNDLTTPHVASLFIIVDGKAMQAVGDDIIARIAQMEVDISTQMAEIQQLITQANEQQQSINTLKAKVQLVLQNCSAFADEAEIWAEGSDEDVASYGGEHSAKGWALKAGEITSTGLPSEASFDKLSVTGTIEASDSSTRVPNTEWVQNAIQAGGGGVSPDSAITCKSITANGGGANLIAEYSAERNETSSITVTPATQGTASSITLDVRTSNWEYPAQLYMANTLMQVKVPGRMKITVGDKDISPVDLSISTQSYVTQPWKHQLSCELPIWANNGLYIRNRSTNESAFIATNTHEDDAETNPKLSIFGTLSVYGERTATNGSKSSVTMLAHRATSDTDNSYVMLKAADSATGLLSFMDMNDNAIQLGTSIFYYFDKGDKSASTEAIRLGKASGQAYATKRYIYSELIGRFVNGLQIGLINDYAPDGVPFKVLRSDTTTSGKWLAAFGVTPTVPDIADATDSSDKVPNTKWVQAAIAAGGGGGGGTGGAVDSINGKTGVVVLSGQDIKTDPNATNTIYQDWAELSSRISGKQSEIVQDSVLSLNSITLANSSTGDVGMLKLTSQDGEIEFRPNGTYLGGIIGRSGTGMLIMGNDLHIGYQFNSPTGILVSRTDSKTTHNFATEFTSAVTCSISIAADDNSQQLATTQWVNAAIAAGGGGGGSGAVASVNGKTGAVVLSGEDINLHPTAGEETYPAISDVIDSIGSYLPNDVASDNKLVDNSSLQTSLALYQPKLTAGDGITISTENVISATGGGGGAVTSVNGNTGAVVLTGDNVRINETSTVTLNAALAGKQDSITETSDLTANSITAKGTVTAHILVVGDGYEGTAFTCNTDAELNYDVNIGYSSGRLRCMSNEYNWLFDFNKSASAGDRIRFNDDVTILSTMPDATDSSNIVPTTAWVQGVAATKANINADNFSVAGKAVLAGLSMPSSRYLDLTLGASGVSYTAPANGWLFLMKMATSAAQNIHFSCNGREGIAWGSTNNVNVTLLFPVHAGDVVVVSYNASGATKNFRFIYADGSQPVT